MDDYAMPCPVCGRYIFTEPESYDICPFCGWEDNEFQDDDYNYAGGANDLSLNESRIEYYLRSREDTRHAVREPEAIYYKERSAILQRYAGMNHILEPKRSEQQRVDYRIARQNYMDALHQILLRDLKRDRTQDTQTFSPNGAPWIWFDLGCIDVHMRITDYIPESDRKADTRPCLLDMAVKTSAGWLDYSFSSRCLFSEDADQLLHTLSLFLEERLDEDTIIDPRGCEVEFVFLPESHMELRILLKSANLFASHVALYFDWDNLRALHTYLRLITQKIAMESEEVQNLIDAKLIRF